MGLDALIVQYGGAIGIVVVLIINWWKSRNDKTRAQAEGVRAQAETITALNSALQTALASIASQQRQIDGLVSARSTAQKQLDELRDELRHQKAAYDGEITALKAQIAALKREGLQKDQRIAELETQLEQSEHRKNGLLAKLEALEKRVNGKADKPSTDDQAANAQELRAAEIVLRAHEMQDEDKQRAETGSLTDNVQTEAAVSPAAGETKTDEAATAAEGTEQ